MKELFHFLDYEIKLPELEDWIYKSRELENEIGKDNYLYLLGYNYKNKYAEIEIHDFILKHIVTDKKYAEWKINYLLESNHINFPTENLFEYAKRYPKFLRGKTFEFKQLRTQNKIQIDWNDHITQFARNVSELADGNEKYLFLGTYDNSYIHFLVNRQGEIYKAYDVVDKEVFWAENLIEALEKLILNIE
jgi:hypothetical protein